MSHEPYQAAAFRRLLAHLQSRHDVQNMDLMNLAGFCRNCLAEWYREAAAADGLPMDKQTARTLIYGMPPEEWKARYQTPASADQLKHFEELSKTGAEE